MPVVLLLLPPKEDLDTGFCTFSGESAKERRNVQIVGRVRSPSLSGRSKIEPMQPPAPGVPGRVRALPEIFTVRVPRRRWRRII